MRRLFAVGLLGTVSLAATVAGTTPVSAHQDAVLYNAKWRPEVAVVRWRFTPEFPVEFPTGSGHRQRVRDGAQQWNNVPGATLDFAEDPPFTSNYAAMSCPNQLLLQARNGIHFEPQDGANGTLAITWTCVGTVGLAQGYVYNFEMEWDNAESWYIHTGDAVGGTHDAWSVASHEFGHATGWGAHYDDGSSQTICQDDSAQHTMCRFNYIDTERQRTLEEHDRHTFDSAY